METNFFDDYMSPTKKKEMGERLRHRIDSANEEVPVKESAEDRAIRFYHEDCDDIFKRTRDAINARQQRINETAKKTNLIRSTALLECFMRIWSKSASEEIVNNEMAINIAKGIINAQIQNEGAVMMLHNMKTKSIAMNEMANSIETLIEKCDKSDECDDEKKDKLLTVDPTSKSEFFDDIDNAADIEDITDSIKSRVSNAVSNFVNATAANKAAIEDVINDIKDKTAEAKDDEIKEAYQARANAAISRINHRDTNLFGRIANNLAESALTNDQLKSVLVENGQINFGKVMVWTESVYTVMEMFNTTKMINFTPDKLAEITKSYKV